MHCTKSCGKCLGVRIFIGSAHVKVWIGLDISASDDFFNGKKIRRSFSVAQTQIHLGRTSKHSRVAAFFRISAPSKLWPAVVERSCRMTRAMTSLFHFKLRSSGGGPNDWPPRKILELQKKTRSWTQNCGVRWNNFDPQASFWMAMLKTLPCFTCFVFQSNWNSHFGACLWLFWCWKRVLKSRTSICKVLQVFKSFFLEEQKMDPAKSSGSFPMKHLKETHNSELVSVKISFGSVKIHDVFQPNFW